MSRKIAIIASILFLQLPVLAVQKSTPSTIPQVVADNSACEIKAENGDTGEFSAEQLKTLANRITVRVIGDKNGGSGTLIAKRGNKYLVLTNHHVIRGVNSIQIKTADGKTYNAAITPNTKFDNYDLALLEFQSNQNYCLQEVANFLPNSDTQVMAAGYSSAKGEIVFSTGTVQQIWDRPLKEGYQIGYTSDIEQGMSGGVILNPVGQIIGVNGRSAYPILNTGYVYPDGSRPSDEEIQQMRKLSWGIPITTFLAQVNNQTLTAYSLPLPKQTYTVPTTQLAGWLGELEQKAKQITVRIDSSSNANGSGIIIAKDGDTYTVLTAAHVLCEREDAAKPCGNYNYQILAPDGKQYPVDKSTIKTESGVDLGIVKFTAPNQNYQVATLANYNPNTGDYMFTAGYPKLGDTSPWRLTMGQIFDKERGLLASSQSDFSTDDSSKLQTARSLTGGYELVYTSITYGGMSGGGVLDSQGRVIGIHGRAEGEQAIDEKTGDRGSSRGQVQLGYSLGIPTSTFLGLSTRLGVQAQKVETTVPLQLNAQQIKSIQEAILSTDISQGNTTASQWLERGNQLWRLRRYEEAVKAFDEAIKLKPSFVYLAYYGKGLVLGWNGKYQEAVAALKSATELKSDYISAWDTISVVYRKLNQPEKALVAIEKAIKIQPRNPNFYNEQYVVLDNLKRYAEAETAINKAIELNPRAAFYNNRGIFYYEQKKWDLALADYNQALKINPDYADAYNNRGNFYKKHKKGDLALVDYNQAIKINPDLAEAYNNRGDLYYDQKKWELALADYNQSIKINPDLAEAYYNRGNLYKEQKKWELALADFNQSLKINPDFAQGYIGRGIIYYEQKKRESALADFNQSIKINPDFADAYYNRGNFYKKQKKWDLALADFNQSLKINPALALAYCSRGIIYYEQKKWDLALADYNQALKINPDYADAYYSRGIIYYEQKKWDLALADYNQVLKINPDFADAYYSRGIIYYDQNKWDLALADYNQVLKINPDFAQGYIVRGIIYYDQNKRELALADYNQALKINPDLAQGYIVRGSLYYEQKKWDLALNDFNQAIKTNPGFAQGYIVRGSLYYDLQKWELALADFYQSLKISPENVLAYIGRGLVYKKLQKWELALDDFNQAIKINPDFAQGYINRGILYHEQNKYTLALAEYNQALAKDEKLLLGINNIGLIKYEQGAIDEAVKQWQQAINLDNKSAEPHLAIAVALYKKGEQETAYKLAQTALQLDKNFADINFLKKNLWGENLIADAQKLLSSPQIQSLLSQMR
ncbi:MAG TPA: tetratricopeptide repeat protein [Trichormus sp. M33_DOE_039]|nr:tetratricopeptide repeat protein [Trichormus sp. M33_DOE_039]